MRFQAEVIVSLKKGVLDPQGSAVEGAIRSMGYEGVGQVRFGKQITLSVAAESREAAEALVADLCKRILTNPVMETFTFTVTEVA